MINEDFPETKINDFWIYPSYEDKHYTFSNVTIPKGTIYIQDGIDAFTLEQAKNYVREFQEAIDFIENYADE